jgi:NitT/TauT family transport system substrate-binding protein
VFQRDAACIASMPGKPILNLADMLDKTICVPNVVRGQISSLLRREGYDPQRVRFVPGGTDASLLIEGEVDGIYEWATRLKPAMDAVGISASYLHLADVGAPGYAQLLFARRDRVEQHFDLFVRYTRALVDGWQWMVNYPVETARLVCDRYAPPGTDLARQTAEAKLMRSYITDGDGTSRGLLWVNPDPFEQAIRLAYDAGDIPRGVKITPDDLMTSKVVEAVHAKS